MKRQIVIVTLYALVGACVIGFAQNKPSSNDLLSVLLKPQQQKQCGLQKLSQRERQSLNQVLLEILNLTRQSRELGDSAVEYLKNEGWEEVEVLDTSNLNFDDNVFAEAGVWTYILEPMTFSSLRPGTYLGEMGFVSCEIIDSDGDVVRFWTKDTK